MQHCERERKDFLWIYFLSCLFHGFASFRVCSTDLRCYERERRSFQQFEGGEAGFDFDFPPLMKKRGKEFVFLWIKGGKCLVSVCCTKTGSARRWWGEWGSGFGGKWWNKKRGYCWWVAFFLREEKHFKFSFWFILHIWRDFLLMNEFRERGVCSFIMREKEETLSWLKHLDFPYLFHLMCFGKGLPLTNTHFCLPNNIYDG